VIEVKGVNEAIAAINALYNEEEVEDITLGVLHRLQVVAMDNTPVDTGAMRSSWVVEGFKLQISPTATNPRTGAPVTDYAREVSDREGIMETVIRMAPKVLREEAQRYGY
jgi:hypothetical protein